MYTLEHASDCAIHNEPAMPAGACDCNAYDTYSCEYDTPKQALSRHASMCTRAAIKADADADVLEQKVSALREYAAEKRNIAAQCAAAIAALERH